MTHLLVALAELLGITWFAATAPRSPSGRPISIPVAALTFFFAGAVLGAPTAGVFSALPSLLAIAISLAALLLVLAGAKVAGLHVGASTSPIASLIYGICFFAGALSGLALLQP